MEDKEGSGETKGKEKKDLPLEAQLSKLQIA